MANYFSNQGVANSVLGAQGGQPQVDPNQQRMINAGQIPGAYVPLPGAPQGGSAVAGQLQALMAGQQANQPGQLQQAQQNQAMQTGMAPQGGVPGQGTASQVDPGMSATPQGVQGVQPQGGSNYFNSQAAQAVMQGAMQNFGMQGGQAPQGYQAQQPQQGNSFVPMQQQQAAAQSQARYQPVNDWGPPQGYQSHWQSPTQQGQQYAQGNGDASGFGGQTPAGIVISGGGALTVGVKESAKRILAMPVRVGGPNNIKGIIDEVQSPAFATVIGLTLSSTRSESKRSGKLSLNSFKVPGGSSGKLVKKLINLVKSFIP